MESESKVRQDSKLTKYQAWYKRILRKYEKDHFDFISFVENGIPINVKLFVNEKSVIRFCKDTFFMDNYTGETWGIESKEGLKILRVWIHDKTQKKHKRIHN